MSYVSKDTLQLKRESDIIEPFILEDNAVITSDIDLGLKSTNRSAGEFVDSSELIAEVRSDYNDIEFPRSK